MRRFDRSPLSAEPEIRTLDSKVVYQNRWMKVREDQVLHAKDLVAGEPEREREEQDMISRSFAIAEVQAMIRDGTIKDATTVACLGMASLKGLL